MNDGSMNDGSMNDAPLDRRGLALAFDLSASLGPFVFCALGASAADSANLARAALPTLLLSLAVTLVLQTGLLVTRAQTLGKWLLGLRVVDAEPGRSHFRFRLLALRTFVPLLFVLVPYLGLFFIALDYAFVLSAQRRAVHDHWSGTRVVSD